jgi:hypothetical protein
VGQTLDPDGFVDHDAWFDEWKAIGKAEWVPKPHCDSWTGSGGNNGGVFYETVAETTAYSTRVCEPWIISMYWAVCGAHICLCVCGVIL